MRPFFLSATLVVYLLAAPATRAGTNLLVNPGFENGYYLDSGIPELAVPNGWRLHYLDGVPFAGIAEGYVARRPETVVWYIQDAPLSERTLFFLNGNYTVKVFKPWAPVYAGLSQDVGGLQAGEEYEFVASVFVDVIESYAGGAKVPPTNEPDGVVVRTGVSEVGAAWRDESRIRYATGRTAGNTTPFHQTFLTLRQTFFATAPRMTVWVEVFSKYAYVNNGFFMDRFELSRVGAAPATAVPTSPAPTAILPPSNPTQAAVPTSVPVSPTLAESSRYIVQRGDTLWSIARRHGTTMAAIAAANGIVNYSRIYAGQSLIIPGGSASLPVSPTAQPPGPSGGVYVVQRGDTLSGIAVRFGTTTAALAAANGITNYSRIYTGQVLRIPTAVRLYTVQRGDTLASIAARFGTTVAALQTANGLSNINLVYTGQVLRIP